MKIACPRCGADISFDPSTGKVYCEYCGSYSDISEVELNQYNKEKAKVQASTQSKPDSDQSNEPSYGAIKEDDSDIYDEFHCSSCGAQLITDKTTTITRCVFCGSQQMIKQRMTGRFEPKKILPFKINQASFLSIYRTFINKKIFAPNEFRNNPFIKEIRGLYVPFYLYNYNVISYGRGQAEERRDKTTYYKWFEYQQQETALVQIDGSTRLDDSIMSSLEPFYMNALVDYNPAYITGFQAEKTDEAAESLDMKAENRVIMQSNKVVNNHVRPYRQTGGYLVSDFTKKCDPEYALFPIWFVNTNFNNKKYSYAINGQTGKVVGEVPISKPKFYTLMSILTSIAVVLTLFIGILWLSGSSSRSRSSSDSDDGPIGAIVAVWACGVVAPYIAIRKRYKNVSHVLSNPIKTWDVKVLKDVKYSKGEYKRTYPNDDLKHITFQKFNQGKFVTNIDINRMVKDSVSNLNTNFTVNKDEL